VSMGFIHSLLAQSKDASSTATSTDACKKISRGQIHPRRLYLAPPASAPWPSLPGRAGCLRVLGWDRGHHSSREPWTHWPTSSCLPTCLLALGAQRIEPQEHRERGACFLSPGLPVLAVRPGHPGQAGRSGQGVQGRLAVRPGRPGQAGRSGQGVQGRLAGQARAAPLGCKRWIPL